MTTTAFESRDLSPDPLLHQDTEDRGKHLGPNRRQEDRRCHQERRGDVRFDTRGDRREAFGRRHGEKLNQLW
jgi:hypothetical protein